MTLLKVIIAITLAIVCTKFHVYPIVSGRLIADNVKPDGSLRQKSPQMITKNN